MRHFRHLEWVLSRRFAIELDAQSRARRRQQIPILPFRLHRHHVRQHRTGLARLFLHAEVAASQVQLQAGCRRYGAEWVMHRQLDIVRLTPTGDFPGFAEAPDNAQIDAGVVDPLLFD